MNKLLFFALIILVGCGKPTASKDSEVIASSIIAGENVEATDPVALSTISLKDCSATLISPDLLVTAAHCVSEQVGFNRVGVIKKVSILTNLSWLSKYTDSSEIILHPKYFINIFDNKIEDYDIAIIKIPKALPSDRFKPVAILAPEYLLEANTELLLAGYGAQSAQDSSVTYKYPLQKTKKTFLNYLENRLVIKQENGKEGVYHGDSGGPAYLETQMGLLLVGATSRPGEGQTVHFANVSAYKDFILESAKALKAQAPTFKMPNE
jgi:secreted trypsin-like serine protease